jgi:hypothetical protein
MKWLVAHARALESALGYATSHFRDYLFKLILFLVDLAPLTPVLFVRKKLINVTLIKRQLMAQSESVKIK